MYLVPALLLLEAESPDAAKRVAELVFSDHAIHVGRARQLSQPAIATADFDVRVYANNIELPPAQA